MSPAGGRPRLSPDDSDRAQLLLRPDLVGAWQAFTSALWPHDDSNTVILILPVGAVEHLVTMIKFSPSTV